MALTTPAKADQFYEKLQKRLDISTLICQDETKPEKDRVFACGAVVALTSTIIEYEAEHVNDYEEYDPPVKKQSWRPALR